MNSLRDYIEIEVTKNKGVFFIRLLMVYLFGGGSRCLLLYRVGKYLYDKGYARLSRLFFIKLQRQYGLYIHPEASIGLGVELPHPTSIVIGQGVKIGCEVVIYQNTTFGGARRGDWGAMNYPSVGDNSVIFSGAVLVGDISLGEYCVVGANSLVNKSVPSCSTVAGVPARLI